MNAIVVGQRGALRDGLIALLYTVPQIRVVSATEDFAPAFELMTEQGFLFALLQVDPPGSAYAAWVKSVKDKAPDTKILALVGDPSSAPYLSAAGVDIVLIQGTGTDKLREALEALASSS